MFASLRDQHHITHLYFTKPQQWQQGQALMKREGNWDRFVTHVALAQTVEPLPGALDDITLRRLLTRRSAKIEDRGRSLHLAAIPFDNAGRRHIGDLVVIRDITALECNTPNCASRPSARWVAQET